MTRQETAEVLAVLKTAYPAFYSQKRREELNAVLDLWTHMFAAEPVEAVKIALVELIAEHSGFPPDIAAVKKKLRNMVRAVTGEPTDEELWQIYCDAASHCLYRERAAFDQLPPILQKYAGSPSALVEHAKMDSETFRTVVKGQFLKQIPVLREREEYRNRLPENVKQLLGSLAKPIPSGYLPPSEKEVNDRKNRLLAKLDERRWE